MPSTVAASFDLSSVISTCNSSVYINYVNVHLLIDKLDDTNYATWALDVKLWLKRQGMLIISLRK